MTDIKLLYITAENVAEAQRIGRVLVEEKLAACANILPGMTSIYRWQGQVEEATEAVLIVKTRASVVDAVSERVQALHRYECPCLLVLPVEGGLPPYLDWLAEQTEDSG